MPLVLCQFSAVPKLSEKALDNASIDSIYLAHEVDSNASLKKARKTMEVKVTQIQCSGSYRSLSAMYEIIKSVFASLPPLELLENYNSQRYAAWYEENFSDNPGNQGAVLMASLPVTSNKEYRYSLITPTSGREISLTFDKYSFLTLSVEFPGGSTYAALKLLTEYNGLEEKPKFRATCVDDEHQEWLIDPQGLVVGHYTDDEEYIELVEEYARNFVA